LSFIVAKVCGSLVTSESVLSEVLVGGGRPGGYGFGKQK